ncbi:autoinducer 2 ABC transporter substrate-binding protein [Mycobacterium sp. 21AC1]|uniref:autoinducer 2 ABC transporter substrate-binding protein n=1 Tax=[Mycobacterium] appelbergii TaxID=2939269 RepID=UPI0029393BB0|nr:autoinducer 2 ABC transporter substrate-binding protein [Mycobacterium sp. 21AC1]MDV3128003.1 autoinducer 2 ABC transporter substrate-binding protein [Mycobacterium sp. 21AC1]
MRISRRFVGAVSVVLALAMVTGGCTKKDTSAPATTGGAGASEESGSSAGNVKVAFVPKLQGSPYFEAMDTGAKQAAADLGDVEWLYQGPTSADAAAQAQIVRSFIQQKVDVLVIAPNDPDSMAPLMKQAQDAGIKVLTADTDAPNSVREAFVNQATAEGIGNTTAETLMQAMGGKGKWAIVSCGETAENLNSWIAAEKAYVSQKYPEAELVDVVYSGEDQARGTQMSIDLMSAHPDLKGLIGQCTTSAVGVAQAVKDAGKIGQVFTVGIGTPKSMKPYLADGSSSGSILWNVQNLGYLTAWAGEQLAKGKTFEATNKVNDDMPDVKWDEAAKTLVLGDPLLITTENVDQFNY